MIKQPINYKQTDPKWKNKPYALKGETSTIGGAGCGPTSVADLLSTFINKNITPETECNWALNHGYKAFKQGTFYNYIEERLNSFSKFNCVRMNYNNLHNNPNSSIHNTALNFLKKTGTCLIACMGKGPWTSSGHYILVWGYNKETDCVLINDPASSKTSREVAKFNIFKQTVKYYWKITINNYNEEKDDEEMDVNKITEVDANSILEKARDLLRKIKEPSKFLKEEIEKAKKLNITDGSRPSDLCTREEAAVMALRAFESDKKIDLNIDDFSDVIESGISDGSRPKDYCTREEAMLMAYRALVKSIEKIKNGDV